MIDVMRSCYDADMAFFKDDPSVLTRVRWFFVPEGTPHVPFPNLFMSQTWNIGEEPEPTLGERYAGRRWRGGLPPYPINVGSMCGTNEQWGNGALTTDPVPSTWADSLVPLCCNRPNPTAMGGMAFGVKSFIGACCGLTPFAGVEILNVISANPALAITAGQQLPVYHDGGICPLVSPDPYLYRTAPILVTDVELVGLIYCNPPGSIVPFDLLWVTPDFASVVSTRVVTTANCAIRPIRLYSSQLFPMIGHPFGVFAEFGMNV